MAITGRINSKTINKSIRFPHDMDAAISELAEEDGRSYGAMVVQIMRKFFRAQKRRGK